VPSPVLVSLGYEKVTDFVVVVSTSIEVTNELREVFTKCTKVEPVPQLFRLGKRTKILKLVAKCKFKNSRLRAVQRLLKSVVILRFNHKIVEVVKVVKRAFAALVLAIRNVNIDEFKRVAISIE
jgi:hypothetical protein